MRINSSFFFAFTLILLLSPTVHPFGSYATANLSTTWTNNDSYGQPMLLRGTNVAQFACGFFCVAFCDFNEKNRATYIFAVFVSGTNEFSWKSEVVWSANGDHPVKDNAILNFTEDGDLMLKDGDGSIVWTADTAGKSVAGMNLTDTGNLVLFDHQNSVVWQSFDYPTDCLLPGQKMSQGQKLKSSVLLTNSSGQEGMYSLQVTDKGVFAYVESNPPQAYYNMFDYAYVNDANKGRRNIRFLNGSLSFFIDSYEQSDPVDAISIQRALSIQYMKLMPDGHLNVFEWQSQGWTVVADLLENTYVGECGYPLVCRRNGICSTSQQCICPLKEYFRPVNDGQPNQGCSQITQLSCSSNKINNLSNSRTPNTSPLLLTWKGWMWRLANKHV